MPERYTKRELLKQALGLNTGAGLLLTCCKQASQTAVKLKPMAKEPFSAPSPIVSLRNAQPSLPAAGIVPPAGHNVALFSRDSAADKGDYERYDPNNVFRNEQSIADPAAR